MSDLEAYKQWVLSADARAIVDQLDQEIRTPVGLAQNVANLLVMMQNPSAKLRSRMESGELDQMQMINEILGHLEQVQNVLTFFKGVFEEP
jgi:hypothetical protein